MVSLLTLSMFPREPVYTLNYSQPCFISLIQGQTIKLLNVTDAVTTTNNNSQKNEEIIHWILGHVISLAQQQNNSSPQKNHSKCVLSMLQKQSRL